MQPATWSTWGEFWFRVDLGVYVTYMSLDLFCFYQERGQSPDGSEQGREAMEEARMILLPRHHFPNEAKQMLADWKITDPQGPFQQWVVNEACPERTQVWEESGYWLGWRVERKSKMTVWSLHGNPAKKQKTKTSKQVDKGWWPKIRYTEIRWEWLWSKTKIYSPRGWNDRMRDVQQTRQSTSQGRKTESELNHSAWFYIPKSLSFCRLWNASKLSEVQNSGKNHTMSA